MPPENTSPKRYWYARREGYEARSRRRLQHDLGVDEAVAEVILRLNRQVIELQSQIQQIETELVEKNTNQNLRLAHYREVYIEATWIELEF
jgi:hypothetical protein